MIQYIYFVKCPNCEDEHFDFFDEAKEFALSCLSQKPIITQIEVCRNDFGECTDSTDLGTVWSWEDMMKDTEAEPAISVFTKDDLMEYTPDEDPEFAALDNSIDEDSFSSVEDAIDFLVRDEEEAIAGYEKVEDALKTFEVENEKEILDILDHIKEEEVEHIEELKAVHERKPIPEGMTIEQLVEEMEENEDTVECKNCGDLFDKDGCHKEADFGWLCSRCKDAIKSRGETLTFEESATLDRHAPDYSSDATAEDLAHDTDALGESFNGEETVDLDYDALTITVSGPKRDVDDWDEAEHTGSYTYSVSKNDVATAIWENYITDDDVADVPGGLEALADDAAWEKFLETHFDILFDKYYDELLKYFEDVATEDFSDTYGWDDLLADEEAWWFDEQLSSATRKSKTRTLEEFEHDTEYNKRLTTCPECGTTSFDSEVGFCIGCGFIV